jgi:hypothetical protein
MADVIQRIWKSGTRRVKRAAWGYTLQVNGKQERKLQRRVDEGGRAGGARRTPGGAQRRPPVG